MSLSEPKDIGPSTPARKPCIAIMGEFSAGKSTLTNLLIGSDPLPVKVTATQLPPVWISHGDQNPYREDFEGNQIPIELTELDKIPLQETALIRIFLQADILELCDIIDMPGISDPNMSSSVWERVIHNADGVLWCTHATQAWRQSEAAVWKSLSDDLAEKSFLLITRIDKLLTERDRLKVIKRVSRETSGQFSQIFPISLTQAQQAGEDAELWKQSGAEDFSQGLVDLIHRTSQTLGNAPAPLLRLSPEPDPDSETCENESTIVHLEETIQPGPDPLPKGAGPMQVVPARVKVAASSARPARRSERPAQTPVL